MKKEVYYIVSARCHQVKYVDGTVTTPDDQLIWLGESDGYPSCTTRKDQAKKWSEIPHAYECYVWDGAPWYYRIKPESFACYEIVTITQDPIIEEKKVWAGTEA